MKYLKTAALTLVLVLSGATTGFAQGWIQDHGDWYYLDAQENRLTGWYQDANQSWYYLKEDGSMASQEWILDHGQSYYLDESGVWISDIPE